MKETLLNKLIYLAFAAVMGLMAWFFFENQIFLREQEMWCGDLPGNLYELCLAVFCALACIVSLGVALFGKWHETTGQ